MTSAIEENITLLVLLPIVFMLHDFEEIIFMEIWYRRNRSKLKEKLPRLYPILEKKMYGFTTASFALSVACMFLLVSACTIYSFLTRDYIVWWVAFLIFSLHLLVHISQSVAVRGYVPAVVTSLLCLPYSIYVFYVMHDAFTLTNTLVGLAIALPMTFTYLALALAMPKWLGGIYQNHL